MKSLYFIFFLFVIITSCKKVKEPSKMTFNRVLILGNSITFHKADESLGWKNNWGMAASVQDSDYIHILIRKFKIKNPEVNFKYINFSQFENEYEKYSLNNIDSLKQFKPNLLILRMGENVDINKIDINDFSAHYKDLIKYFQNNNPSLKIICVSNFWRSPKVEDIIKKCANSEGVSYISLSHLDKEEFTAWGLFNNSAVGSHPGNKGMKAIADLIWQEIEK